MKNKLWIVMFILVLSCARNTKQNEMIDSEVLGVTENYTIDEIKEDLETQETINFWDNYDWITEFDWTMNGGKHLIDPSLGYDYWVGDMTPIVRIYKFNIPKNSDLYQVRLRNEHFYFNYQTEEKDKLFPIENTFFDNIYNIRFNNEYSNLTLLNSNGKFYSGKDRIGHQTILDKPLVGIWGKSYNLTEYKSISIEDCLYYMEIDRKIPGYAIREGTYLLKQTGEREFETISSFPDGLLKLEVIHNTMIVITPLFELPDEEGWVAPLIITCNPYYPRYSTD